MSETEKNTPATEIKFSKEVSEVGEKIEKWNLGKLNELIEWIKQKFNIQEQAVVQTAVQSEEKVEVKDRNVSLHILEIGNQAIKVYGKVKDIVNEAGGKINIVNAKQMIDQKKPILENIPETKADEYKKQLENEGAKVEIK